MTFSFIIPVYNRPDEVAELLESLTRQSLTDFEVIVVEDGSQIPCQEVCNRYAGQLRLKYYCKPNSGPGQSRNYGAERAEGDYLLILDSDVVLPPHFLAAVQQELQHRAADAFGGPDKAHPDFTPLQKAISYSMTSFFTTGGIRGGKKKLDKFYPRSFNMGVRTEVYRRLGGFSDMRFGEDIDFSIRIFASGASCRLFPKAWVWHKRRTDLHKFWRQVYNSGIARINLYKKYPDSLKAVHLLPALFTLFALCTMLWTAACLLGAALSPSAAFLWLCAGAFGAAPLAVYSGMIATDAAMQYGSMRIGVLAVAAAFCQLLGYGCGFLHAWWQRCVCGKGAYSAYEKTFYK